MWLICGLEVYYSFICERFEMFGFFQFWTHEIRKQTHESAPESVMVWAVGLNVHKSHDRGINLLKYNGRTVQREDKTRCGSIHISYMAGSLEGFITWIVFWCQLTRSPQVPVKVGDMYESDQAKGWPEKLWNLHPWGYFNGIWMLS